MSTKENIDKLFSLLDDWRLLPAYQLERRADIFFALYLPHIMKARFGALVDHDHIIPEFPLNKKTLGIEKNPGFNLSYKVDYLIVCKKSKKVFLVELKTDTGSRRSIQDEYLLKAQAANVKKWMEGVIDLQKASKSTKKYQKLVEKLKSFGWIDPSGNPTEQEYQFEIVYIQPLQEENVITFREIITTLEGIDDDLTKRFVESLKRWESAPGQG